MLSKYQNYLEYYVDSIRPAINELDIAIKCHSRLKNNEIAKILGASEQEIEEIREKHKLSSINQKSIVKIMQSSHSPICKIFQRELELGSPFTYTKEQFAYIYDFDLDMVNDACEQLDISEITWQNMPAVFVYLPFLG